MALRHPQPHHTQLTPTDREFIRRLLADRWSIPEIARTLRKDRSTVWRELKRNRNAGGVYYERHAHVLARERRVRAKQPLRIIENDLMLEAFVERLLRDGLSPEQIAGYMRRTHHVRPLTHKTIYAWVHRRWQSRKAYLRFRGRARVPYGMRKRAWQPHKRHISERPEVVRHRRRSGDWEADLVHGTRDDSTHCLLTLNERATGFCVIRKLRRADAATVTSALVSALSGLPVRTITCDNGTEFARHKTIERSLKCHVYFADPHNPRQRASNENLNGLVREYFPKGVSLAHVTEAKAVEVATKLNRRPRKRFNYDCPRNMFANLTGLSPYLAR